MIQGRLHTYGPRLPSVFRSVCSRRRTRARKFFTSFMLFLFSERGGFGRPNALYRRWVCFALHLL